MINKVLLIEDDVNLAFMLIDGLESEGFEIHHIARGEEAIEVFLEFEPNIILLDVNLKGVMTGFEASREIRKRSDVPIIFTTSRAQFEDLQEGFQIGNVDYLKKPYSIRELGLRIKGLLMRYEHAEKAKSADDENRIHLANYVFSPMEQTLQNIDTIRLMKNESLVLEYLCKHVNEVVTKKELLEFVWGDGEIQARENSLYNILTSLRTKLSGDSHVSIQTISKVGYKLELERRD
ncbi:MAG: response regulator transcription factor [Bacteroidales bacterium]